MFLSSFLCSFSQSRSPPPKREQVDQVKRSRSYSRSPEPRKASPSPPPKTRKRSPTPEEGSPMEVKSPPSPTREEGAYSQSPRERSGSPSSPSRDSPAPRKYDDSPAEANGGSRSPSPKYRRNHADDDDEDEDEFHNRRSGRESQSPWNLVESFWMHFVDILSRLDLVRTNEMYLKELTCIYIWDYMLVQCLEFDEY